MKERLVTYINSLNMGNGLFLEGLEEDAKQARIPIIRKETQQLLKLLLAMNCPERILEIGTAVGFSALLMELGNPRACHITTVENYGKRIPVARENFMRAGQKNSCCKSKFFARREGKCDRIIGRGCQPSNEGAGRTI